MIRMAAGGQNRQMTEDRDQWADNLSAEHSGGWLTGFFAEENRLDRRAKLRLASWGVGAVGAVTLAVLASQFSAQSRREQLAATDLLARQAQQIELVARQTQTDSRRLSAAVDTLNSDRDRLFSRVTSVEQGLESVTGTIKRQAAAVVAPPVIASGPAVPLAAAPPQAAAEAQGLPPVTPPPSIGPVATAPPVQIASAKSIAVAPPQAAPARALPVAPVPVAAEPATKSTVIGPTLMPAPLMAEKSMMGPPDSAAMPLSEPTHKIAEKFEKSDKTDKPATVLASAQTVDTAPTAAELPAVPVQRTEFGIDLGGANTIDGLRALWRGRVASNKALDRLRPIIVLREFPNGPGMQLRLVAGPIGDAAAAKLCAALNSSERPCETSVFEGQRLAMKSESSPKNETKGAETPVAPIKPIRPTRRKRGAPPVELRSEVPAAKPEEPAPKPAPSVTSFLGLR
jgi:hypothetical protein